MNVDVGPNIASMLERLATQLGTTADKVFPWYVQQAYLDGVISLSVISAGLFLSLLALTYGVWNGKWKNGDPENLPAVLTIVGAIGVFVMTVGVISVGPESATKILNPQYHAMKMLTRDVGNMVGK